MQKLEIKQIKKGFECRNTTRCDNLPYHVRFPIIPLPDPVDPTLPSFPLCLREQVTLM